MTDQERQEQQYSEWLSGLAAGTVTLFALQETISQKYRDDLVKEVSKIYQNNWSFEDYQKFGRSSKVEKRVIKIIDAMYKEHHSIIYDILKAEYIDKASIQVNVLNEQNGLISITKKFDAKAAINQPNGGVYWFDRLGKNRNDILYNLSNTINAGLYNGESYSATTKKLQEIFGNDLIKNDTIARTETRRVTSVAQTDVCDSVANSVNLVKTWKTMGDGRVRSGGTTKKGKLKADHVKMNGVTIPYNQDFITPTGSKGKAPHQMIGPKSAGDNCNCRCIMLVRVK